MFLKHMSNLILQISKPLKWFGIGKNNLPNWTKQKNVFAELDIRKDGWTKSHQLIKIVCEVLEEVYPEFPFSLFYDKMKNMEIINYDGTTLSGFTRGSGLGMANELATLVNGAFFLMLKYQEFIVVNDDLLIKLKTPYIEPLSLNYNLITKEMNFLKSIIENMDTILYPKKCVSSEYWRFCEIYSKNVPFNSKDGLIYTALHKLFFQPNIIGAKKLFSTWSLAYGYRTGIQFDILKNLLISFWGKEGFPDEYDSPYECGGWGIKNDNNLNPLYTWLENCANPTFYYHFIQEDVEKVEIKSIKKKIKKTFLDNYYMKFEMPDPERFGFLKDYLIENYQKQLLNLLNSSNNPDSTSIYRYTCNQIKKQRRIFLKKWKNSNFKKYFNHESLVNMAIKIKKDNNTDYMIPECIIDKEFVGSGFYTKNKWKNVSNDTATGSMLEKTYNFLCQFTDIETNLSLNQRSFWRNFIGINKTLFLDKRNLYQSLRVMNDYEKNIYSTFGNVEIVTAEFFSRKGSDFFSFKPWFNYGRELKDEDINHLIRNNEFMYMKEIGIIMDWDLEIQTLFHKMIKYDIPKTEISRILLTAKALEIPIRELKIALKDIKFFSEELDSNQEEICGTDNFLLDFNVPFIGDYDITFIRDEKDERPIIDLYNMGSDSDEEEGSIEVFKNIEEDQKVNPEEFFDYEEHFSGDEEYVYSEEDEY